MPLHLGELGGDEIVVVLQRLVEMLRNNKGLTEAVGVARVVAQEKRMAKQGNVGNTVNVFGQAGAVAIGSGARATGTINVQEIRGALLDGQFLPEHAAILIELATSLASASIPGISLSERLAGAQHISAIAERRGEEQVAAVAAWRDWIAKLGPAAERVLTVLANVTTVAAPFVPMIARLLGMPLP